MPWRGTGKRGGWPREGLGGLSLVLLAGTVLLNLARGTRLFRVSYVQTSAASAGAVCWSLPLRFAKATSARGEGTLHCKMAVGPSERVAKAEDHHVWKIKNNERVL